MSDNELQMLVDHLRQYVLKERQEDYKSKKIGVFFLNVIEIASSLTELGLTQNRKISNDDRYWFEGGYHMNFWDSEIETDYYSPLCREVERRNWFSKPFVKL